VLKVTARDLLMFAKNFTLTEQSKQEKMKYFLSGKYKRQYRFRDDVIPGCLFADGRRADVSRAQLRQLLGKVADDDAWIKQCLSAEVCYDPIVKIEKVASTTPLVFDLTVANTRNFISAQNIACRDTFHFAGVAAKNVTLGVPRIKELIDARRVNQTPATSVYLLKPFSKNRMFVEKYKETLIETYLRDIVQSFEIVLDPDPTTTVVEEKVDQFLVDTHRAFGEPLEEGHSKYVIRMVLKKELLASKELTINNIRDLIKDALPGEKMYHMLTAEPNMSKWIIRIRMCGIQEMKEYLVKQVKKETTGNSKKESKYTHSQVEQIVLEFEKNISHAFVKYLSRTLFICGIPGIEAASVQEANTTKWNVDTLEKENITEYYIHTTGINLQSIWNLTVVDWQRTWCNNIFDILDVLGIEAVAMVLFHEIRTVLSFDGCYVNNRHIMMIVNVMTRSGGIMPLNRHGLNKLEDVGPLAKCTFEESVDIIFDAGLFAENNPVVAVSDNIMMGQSIPGGTGKVSLMMDPDYEKEILKSRNVQKKKLRVVRTYYSQFAHSAPPESERVSRRDNKRRLTEEKEDSDDQINKRSKTRAVIHQLDLRSIEHESDIFSYQHLRTSSESPSYAPTSPSYAPTSPS